MNQKTLDALAKGYLNRELTLDAKDLASAVIYIVNYHIRNKTDMIRDLASAYGTVASVEAVRTYSTSIFDGLVSNNSKASDLFWKMFNSMSNTMIIESINESLDEAAKEVETIDE